jgi:o-succinylbenzoate---CoA ligase
VSVDLKFEISARGRKGNDGYMVLGAELWRESALAWEERGSFMLLNPRMSEGERERVMAAEFPALENHVWLATSGTGGRLKLVALGRDALEASARAVNAHLGVGAGDRWINVLPLFHVGGLGIGVRAMMAGVDCVELAGTWEPGNFVAAVRKCGATLSGLVPTQVHDLVQGGWRAPDCLRAVVVGGGLLSKKLLLEAQALGWPLLPSYGLTEAGSQVATSLPSGAGAEWLPLLPHVEARVDAEGVLELRGSSLLTGWMIFEEGGEVRFEEPKRDGWFRTSDRAELRGRELRVLGRVDDLVKIRGELVDVGALERVLQERVKSGLVRVRQINSEREGVALEVVAENESAAREACELGGEIFPAYARPREFVVGVIQRTALGKLVRS